MFLDRDTVSNLLNKEDGSYDGNLLAIKLLPKDAIFEIVLEEIVTAEYFDEGKNQYFRFELSHDYFSYGKDIAEGHARTLELDLLNSLKEQKEASLNSKGHSLIDKMLIAFGVMLAISANVYMVYVYIL